MVINSSNKNLTLVQVSNDAIGLVASLHNKRVEQDRCIVQFAALTCLEAIFNKSLLDQASFGHYLLSDRSQAVRSVVNSVHGAHVCQKRLCRADVASRLLTAHML